MSRKPLSQKIRFEVFKRDKFTCQYCGNKAPEVVLHCDHIKPVAKGGTNDVLNLVTSCQECNQGKGARELDDDAVVNKQRAQLENNADKIEQIEMLAEWRNGQKDVVEHSIDLLGSAFKEHYPSAALNDNGRKVFKKHLKKYGFEECLKAIDIAGETYLYDEDGQDEVHEAACKAFNKIGGILYNRSKGTGATPQELYYVRGILRNRVYVNEKYIMTLLRNAHEANVNLDSLIEFAKEVRNWTAFRTALEELIEGDADE